MRILTWRNKYGTQMYSAATDEELEGAAREILAELVRDGWIYEPSKPDFDEAERELIRMTEDEVAALPAALRANAEKERADAARRVSQYEDELGELARAKRILAGNVEWELSRARADYDDDRWDRMVEAATSRWFGPVEVREDGIYKKDSAWSILQERDGAEYEDYRLDSLTTHTVKNW